jgi:hypothetical protein
MDGLLNRVPDGVDGNGCTGLPSTSIHPLPRNGGVDDHPANNTHRFRRSQISESEQARSRSIESVEADNLMFDM